MDEMEKCNDKELINRIFNSCGADCAKTCGIIDVAKRIKCDIQNASSFDEILKILNMNFQGTFSKIDEGFIIEYGPWDCDCEIVRENNIKSPLFCRCTAGFHEYIWHYVFDRKVNVYTLQTVLGGDCVCRLKVVFA